MGDVFDQVQQQQQTPQSGDVFDQATRQPSTPATPTQSTAAPTAAPTGASGFGQGVYDSTIGPLVNLAENEYQHVTAPRSTAESDPVIDAIKGIVDSHRQVAHKAIQAIKEHRYSEAAGYGGATVLPVLGPAAAKAGEDIGHGETAYGLGEGAGLIGSVLAPKAVGKAAKAAGGLSDAVLDATKTSRIQPGLQSGLREIASDAANESGVSVPKSASIRDVFEKTGDAIQAKSKSIYQRLDQATGGQFQRFDDALRNINQRLRQVVGVEDDSVETTLLERKAQVEMAQEAAFEQARNAGVDPKLIDEARASYRKAQALYDLDAQIKKATTGMRPDIGDAAQAAKNAELVDPKRLFQRVNNLYDSGRLQDALGEQGANSMLEHANEHYIKHAQVLRNQRLIKTGAKVALVGGALEAGRRSLFPAQGQ